MTLCVFSPFYYSSFLQKPPNPVIARLVPGNPVKNSAALAAILNGGASRRHAKRDTYLPLSSQRK